MVSGYSHNKNVLTVMFAFQILLIFAKIKADDSKPRYFDLHGFLNLL